MCWAIRHDDRAECQTQAKRQKYFGQKAEAHFSAPNLSAVGSSMNLPVSALKPLPFLLVSVRHGWTTEIFLAES
jgi:hypothetical protein